MKRHLLFGLTLLMALCMCSAPESKKPQPQVFNYQPNYKKLKVDTTRLKRIDNLLQDYVDQGIIPHALTFVAKEGYVIHNKAFGWRDVEKQIPLEKDDIFRMYSQTKAVTTVALMTLFEQAKFQLDDPVSKYIPEMTDQVIIPGSDPYAPQTRKAASPVLIRHLLSHSSGINGVRQPRGAPQQPQPETLEAHVKELVKAPLIFDPGTGWNYHPASDVAAYLVEYFSGKSLQEYMKEAIFEPLGIKEMAYYYDEEYKDRFVTCYRADSTGRIEPVEMWSGQTRSPFISDRRMAQGGTGLNGIIEEYARFCQMILNEGTFNNNRVLGRRTVEVMAKNQLADAGGIEATFRFGLGFQIYPGESIHWETQNNFSPMVSAGSLSWGGMANTDYIIDPVENMIILFYTNRVPDTYVWEKFLNAVYQALE